MSSEVIELCRQMVAIPSINPQDASVIKPPYGEGRMADFVYNWLAKHNLNPEKQQVQPERENVYAFVPGADKTKTLLLSAHLDTVDVGGMTVEPFEPQVRDGRLYGRGSCDTKGPLAAIMIAFRDYAGKKEPPYNLAFLATCGEEFNLIGARHYATHHNCPLSAAIFGEPTELKTVVAHKGAMRFWITIRGCSAHSATPQLGDNAIYTMSRAITAIQRYGDKLANKNKHPMLGTETLAVTIIQGGQQTNVIPDRCRAHVDWRTLPGHSQQQCIAELQKILTAEIDEEKITVELSSVYEPMQTDENHPMIEALLNAAQKTTGQRHKTGVNYATDASAFVDMQIPLAIFGPGNAAQAHRQAEYIDIEQLELGLSAYKTFLDSDWGL